MAESFKSSDYIKILRAALHIGNESSSFKSDKIPSLENVVLLSETKTKGIMTWNDFLRIDSET